MSSEKSPIYLPLAKGARIIATDVSNGFIALTKPSGLLSTPNDPKDLNRTLIRAKFIKKDEAYVWFDKEEQRCCFYIGHRLDSPTSGVLVGSTDSQAAKYLRALFKDRKISKTYYALVKGIPHGKNGKWVDRLQTQASRNFVRNSQTRSKAKGDEAVTLWKLVKSNPKLRVSLLELKPQTGRTHQLRVQSSLRKLPIIGDRTYGDFKYNTFASKDLGIKRLMLHASKISIRDKANQVAFDANDPLPELFVQLFDK